jgi:RNA polymerase sigma factor for flagellar operon FliA
MSKTSLISQPSETRSRPSKSIDPRAAELLARYTPVVWQIAGGFQRKLPKSVLHEDLVAAGMSGLWDAIRRQSAQDDERFEWYVRVRIRGAILDELRAQDWLPRRARATAEAEGNAAPAVVRLDDVSELEHAWALASGDATDNAVDAKLQSESLLRAVRQLPERERHIVASYNSGTPIASSTPEASLACRATSSAQARGRSLTRRCDPFPFRARVGRG